MDIPKLGHGTVAVLGGGLIGISWSALFLAHGLDVVLYEPVATGDRGIHDGISAAVAQVSDAMQDLPEPGQLTLTKDLEVAVGSASWIQESAPENVPLKRKLYAAVEAAAPAEVTIASSTSSLVWSELSVEMIDPSRFITAHPFNPPHLMPLVELYGCDRARLKDASSFYRAVGRHPVMLKREAVGHTANRLSSALWREAVNMVAQDIAEVEDIEPPSFTDLDCAGRSSARTWPTIWEASPVGSRTISPTLVQARSAGGRI